MSTLALTRDRERSTRTAIRRHSTRQRKLRVFSSSEGDLSDDDDRHDHGDPYSPSDHGGKGLKVQYAPKCAKLPGKGGRNVKTEPPKVVLRSGWACVSLRWCHYRLRLSTPQCFGSLPYVKIASPNCSL